MEKVFEYVSDHDTAAYKLKNVDEFASGIGSLKINFNKYLNYNLYDTLMSIDADEMIKTGMKTIIEDNLIIDEEVNKHFMIEIEKDNEKLVKCLGVITKFSNFRTQIGHKLACHAIDEGLKGIAVVAYEVDGLDHKYKVSMRSEHDPCIEIASKFGGGGHANAASFFVDKTVFQSWILHNNK